MANEVLPMLNLIDSEWCSWHFNNYQWGTIPEADNPDHRQELFLIPGNNAEYVKTEQIKEGTKPSKKAPVFYRVFADLPGTPELFIQFSNQYGPPFEQISMLRFIQEQRLFKIVVKFWDALQTDKTEYEKFSKIVITETNNPFEKRLDMAVTDDINYFNERLLDRSSFDIMGINKEKPWIGVYVDNENKPFAVVCRGKADDELLKKPAKFFYKALLREIINSKLDTFPVKFNLFQNPDTNIFKQVVRPSNLISFMWYQFLQDVTGERKIKQCSICKRYSDITNVKGEWDHHPECAVKRRVDRTRRRQKGEDIPYGKPGRPKKHSKPFQN